MAQIRIKCSKCAMSTVTGVVAYVIKNVFRRVRNTDSDMSSLYSCLLIYCVKLGSLIFFSFCFDA